MCFDCGDAVSRRAFLGTVSGATVAGLAGVSGAQETVHREVAFEHGGVRLSGRFFQVPGNRRADLVVVAHGNPGFEPGVLALGGWLTSAGFAALIVDWTAHGAPPPADAGQLPEWRRNTVGNAAFWRQGADNMAAGLETVLEQRLASPRGVHGLGICGGGVVIGEWVARGAPLRSLVLYHAAARLKTDRHTVTPVVDLIERVPAFNRPVHAHYGILDSVASVGDARDFERLLTDRGVRNEFYYYPDAGHGFVVDGPPFSQTSGFGYVPFAATQAKTRTLAFLRAEAAR